MLKAVIFDLDGLLVDSTPLQLQATAQFLDKHHKIYLSQSAGEGRRIWDMMSEIKEIYDLPQPLEELYEERQQIFLALIAEELQLKKGALEILKLVAQKNLKLALATSGSRLYVERVFAKFPFFITYFPIVVTGDDVVLGKPNPEIFIKTAEKLGVSAKECIVFEDSINGILSAKQAGMTTIAIPNEYYEADYSHADMIFPDLLDACNQMNLPLI